MDVGRMLERAKEDLVNMGLISPMDPNGENDLKIFKDNRAGFGTGDFLENENLICPNPLEISFSNI